MFENELQRPEISYVSPEWGRIEEWLGAELLMVYRRIAQPQLDERETQFQRGRASMIETMLAFRSMDDALGPH